MKAKETEPPRQIFVLTAKEKKAFAFLLCVLALGVGVKHYRDTHPAAPINVAIKSKANGHSHTFLPKKNKATANKKNSSF